MNIRHSEKSSVYVTQAGDPATTNSNTYPNGFEVDGAEGDGLYVGRADRDGIEVYSAGLRGVHVVSSDMDGVLINQAGGDGVHVGSSDGNALYGDTSDSNNEWGVYTPDKIYTGTTLATRGITTYGFNSGNTPLEHGDVVCLAGGYRENVLSESSVSIVNVMKADAAHSEAVVGVVESAVTIVAEEKTIGMTGKNGKAVPPIIRRRFAQKDGAAPANSFVANITFDPADVKMADKHTVRIGKKLTVSETAGKARCMRPGDDIRINGVIGKTIELFDGEQGMIKVFVNCM